MKKIQAILEHPEYNRYLRELAVAEEGRIFCLHNLEHFLDVARIAYSLYLEGLAGLKDTDSPSSELLPDKCKVGKPVLVENEDKKYLGELDYSPAETKEIIYAIGLLHDIGKPAQYMTGQPHAQVSAELAPDILRDVGFDREEIDLIVEAIRHHNDKIPGQGLNAIIQDADKLSRRCFACQAQDLCYKLDQMVTRHGLLY